MIGTPDENKEAVQGNISTFGTYAVSSDGSISLEVIGSSFPNWDGTKHKSLAEVKGDEMTGAVAELVGIEGGVVSGVINLESSDVGASDRRPRHEEHYHEA